MAAKNDVTGDAIRTKGSTKQYEDNYDRIFRKKEEPKQEEVEKETDGDVSAVR